MYDDEIFTKRIRQEIKDNSARCSFLHEQIHKTYIKRNHSEENRNKWKAACQIFNDQKEQLIFPMGTKRIYIDPKR